MSGIRYTEEFKRDAVSQVKDRGHSVNEVSERLGISDAKPYTTRKSARQDVFDYIEFFYNPKRKHGNNKMLSPIDFEKQQLWK